MKYLHEFKEIKRSVRDTLSCDFFKNIIGDPFFSNKADWTQPNRSRKFASIDIQRNKVLLEKGIKFQNYFNCPDKPVQMKRVQT